jgi:hypothetical protein
MQGSASLTVITEPCEHLEAGAWPLRVELVLDDSMGFTDALVRCRVCDRAYLLEMLDADAGTRLMRVAPVDPDVAAGTLHDLGRGSCDLTRAGAQVHQLQTASVFSRCCCGSTRTNRRFSPGSRCPRSPPARRRMAFAAL